MVNVDEWLRPDSVHAHLYTDPELFRLEMDRLFANGWVYVGHESEIPQRGDTLRRTIGTEPVLFTRGPDGLHVVVNRCTHRGNLLLQPASAQRKAFVCQYHGWVFAQNGDLVSMPLASTETLDRTGRALRRARVDSYRGFVFATFNPAAPPLLEHLGHATRVIDRQCDLSPLGEVQLRAPWIQHLFRANWKMLSENEADGYHVGFVHDSFARGVRIQGKYGDILSDSEEKISAVVRYLGNGHTELDYGPTYTQPLTWLGVKPERYPDYVAALEARLGPARAQEAMRLGPSHAFIFPNLFIAETCLVMIQPVSVDQTINAHAPLYLKGVPDAVNERILRQGEVAMGPSSFLTADDAIIAERQWRALRDAPGWLDISRGRGRETRRADGVLESHYTDETPNRGFWQHYRGMMQGADAAASAPLP